MQIRFSITLALSVAATVTAITIQPHIYKQALHLREDFIYALMTFEALIPELLHKGPVGTDRWKDYKHVLEQVAGPLQEIQTKSLIGRHKPENALLEMILGTVAMKIILDRQAEPEVLAEQIFSKWPQIAGGSIAPAIETFRSDKRRWAAAASYLVTFADGTDDEYSELLRADPSVAIKDTFAVRIAVEEWVLWLEFAPKRLGSSLNYKISDETMRPPAGRLMRLVLDACSGDDVPGQNEDRHNDDDWFDIVEPTEEPSTIFQPWDIKPLVRQLQTIYVRAYYLPKWECPVEEWS